MTPLPSGDVTFLFTDIEGSTRRWETDERAMWSDVRLHNDVLSAAIRVHAGVPFKMVGDAFQAAFSTPIGALRAVVDAQRALADQQWAGGSNLRVRMALHTGDAEPRDGDYLAPCLNRLARLLSTGYGGQALVSSLTAGLLGASLPEGVILRDLGRHRLKDLNEPEQIFQIVADGLQSEFPALKTLDSRPHNLPLQPTSLIGRDDDVAAVRAMLARDDARLVTLTGPGGAGKTRLSLQVGADSLDDFADGVFFVPLAAVTDPGLVLSAIATALRIQETGAVPVAQLLADSLHFKQTLLVLDNFEQVVDAAGDIADLLKACPRIKAVVSSRIRLGVYAEREYPVPPLDLPDPDELPSLDELAENQSIRLFVDRAQAVNPDFELTAANAEALAEICVRLDGLPLAIELAAARIRLLTPRAMLDRMAHSLPLLTGGARDLPARHQTLRNTIAWSVDLLSEDERRLYRRLAICAGWTFEAAEAIVDVSDFDDPFLGGLDGLSALVDHNLVRQSEQSDGQPRFDMLQTIREFGLERLADTNEIDVVAERHARYYVDLAESFEPAVFGPDQIGWLDRLELELDNFRAAVAWSMHSGHPELALQVAGALRRFWELRGHLEEANEWLVAALDASRESTSWRVRAFDAAGNVAAFAGDLPRARKNYELSLEIARQLGLGEAEAETTHNLGNVSLFESDFEHARAKYESALAIFRSTGNRLWEANVLTSLAVVCGNLGELDSAEELLLDSLRIQKAAGNLFGATVALENLATVEEARDNLTRAVEIYEDCLLLYRQLGSSPGIAYCIGSLADLSARLGQWSRAAILYGKEDAMREDLGMPNTLLNSEAHERGLTLVQSELGPEECQRRHDVGRAMSLSDAVAFALSNDDGQRIASGAPVAADSCNLQA